MREKSPFNFITKVKKLNVSSLKLESRKEFLYFHSTLYWRFVPYNEAKRYKRHNNWKEIGKTIPIWRFHGCQCRKFLQGLHKSCYN